VVSPIADATTQTRRSAAASTTRWATVLIRSALASELPPYF
jgi:hypothetical protein